MVNKDIYDDLVSYGKKILFIGDPMQLPPIGDSPEILNEPDYSLTEIVRQAKDSPIIKLAHSIWKNPSLEIGIYEKDVVISNLQNIKDSTYLNADKIIVSTNNMRHYINSKIRDLKGFKDLFPEKGETLICTKNNWDVIFNEDQPLVNGTIVTVNSCSFNGVNLNLCYTPENSENKIHTRISLDPFVGSKEDKFSDDVDFFDFGYAITCHKAQGSEYSNVLVIATNLREDIRKNWLVTAITRAKNKLIIGI